MYQNIMLGALVLVLLLIAQRIYNTWQLEKTRKPAVAASARRPAKKTAKAKGAEGMSAQPFHCVTLVGNCPALEDYKGKRFLASDAPPLPVPDCTSDRCQCHYTHHADRRDPNTDRRALGRFAEEQYTLIGNPERRGSRGRRKSDGNWATIDDWSNAV